MPKWVTVECPRCRKPNLVDPEATTELRCSHCDERTLVVSAGTIGSLTGETIGEIYRIEDRIGQGGFGEVYRARDERLQRIVAIKILSQPSTVEAEPAGRFLREAVTAAQITHPNVVHVYDVRTDPGRGLHYLVMEHVDGRDLGERVEADGPLDEGEVATIGLQIARGLAAAHERGIIHRDIKPSNVMEARDGSVKIMDFGLARVLQVDHATKTQTAGSVAYMPPEQFEGKTVDQRADIYALGATMYFLLSGQTPYGGAHDFNVMYNILSKEPTPLPQVAPQVSSEFWDLIRHMLSKDPAARPQNARDIIAHLEMLLAETGADVLPCAACGTLNGRRVEFCAGCGKGVGAISGRIPLTETSVTEPISRPLAGGARVASQAGVATPPPAPPRPPEAPPAAAPIPGDRTIVDPVGARWLPLLVRLRRGWPVVVAVVAVAAGLVLWQVGLFDGAGQPDDPGGSSTHGPVAPPPQNGETGPVEPPPSPALPTPEGLELLREGDFAGYLGREAEPDVAVVAPLVAAFEEGEAGIGARLAAVARAVAGEPDPREGVAEAVRAGVAVRVDRLAGAELGRLLAGEQPGNLWPALRDLSESLGLLSLPERTFIARRTVEGILGLRVYWRAVTPGEPPRTVVERRADHRRELGLVEGLVEQLGLDASTLRTALSRLIVDDLILSPIDGAEPRDDLDAVVYAEWIPLAELAADIEGVELDEILSRVEEAAAGRGIDLPWKGGE